MKMISKSKIKIQMYYFQQFSLKIEEMILHW